MAAYKTQRMQYCSVCLHWEHGFKRISPAWETLWTESKDVLYMYIKYESWERRERESACGRPQITLFPQWTIKGSNLSIEGELTLYRKLAYFGSRKIKEAHQWKFEEMGQIRRKLWVLESCDRALMIYRKSPIGNAVTGHFFWNFN